MPSPSFPRTFGPYVLLSSFGRGGMGEVFLAKKHAVGDIDRLCVIKTVRGDLAESQEYVRRFLDEARVVVQLSHGNICHVFDAGRVGDEYFLCMEYIAGVNLRELLSDLLGRGAWLDPGVALLITEETLDALYAAHTQRDLTTGEPLHIVHRDISPANVMVSFDAGVKLIDFGLAESTLKVEETATRVVMGKMAYMSPEQARGEDVDATADQFAVAVMLCEMLLGDRFYGKMNTHDIWQIVGRGGYRPEKFDTIDADVRAALDRALASSAADRFPSCEAFREALDQIRSRKFPQGNKRSLRDLCSWLYGERAQQERMRVAAFRDVQAPRNDEDDESERMSGTDPFAHSLSTRRAAASEADQLPVIEPQMTMTQSASVATRSLLEQVQQDTTDKNRGAPQQHSPDGPSPRTRGPVLAPTPAPLPAPASSTERVNRAPGEETRALLPPNRTPQIVTAGAVALFVVVAALLLLGRDKPRLAPMESATIVNAPVAAVQRPATPPTPTPTPPTTTAAPPPTTTPEPQKVEPQKPKAGGNKKTPAKEPKEQTTPVPVAAPVPETPQVALDLGRPLDAHLQREVILRTLEACSLEGARLSAKSTRDVKIPEMTARGKTVGEVDAYVSQNKSIATWYRKCTGTK